MSAPIVHRTARCTRPQLPSSLSRSAPQPSGLGKVHYMLRAIRRGCSRSPPRSWLAHLCEQVRQRAIASSAGVGPGSRAPSRGEPTRSASSGCVGRLGGMLERTLQGLDAVAPVPASTATSRGGAAPGPGPDRPASSRTGIGGPSPRNRRAHLLRGEDLEELALDQRPQFYSDVAGRLGRARRRRRPRRRLECPDRHQQARQLDE